MPLKSWCESCHNEQPRMYVRTLDHNMKRRFEPIGWYCDKCRILKQDELTGYPEYVRAWHGNVVNAKLTHCYNNMHRIYIRSKDNGRGFLPIAWYYTEAELFELDEMRDRGYGIERKLMLERMPPALRAQFEKTKEEIVQESQEEEEARLIEIAIKLLESKGYVVSKPESES